MEIVRQIPEMIRYILSRPATRVIIFVGVVGGIAFGAWWYIMRYRPQAYLNDAYASWAFFEQAVLDARAKEYQYDPYGDLSVDLENVYRQGQEAKQGLAKLNPPTEELKSLQEKSISVIDRFLDISGTIQSDVKKEADYYYNLIGELKNFFDNENIVLANAALSGSSMGKGDYYEVLWKEYRALHEELGGLLTRVEVASVPARLKDFNVQLIRALRESQTIAGNGVEAYQRFMGIVSDKRYTSAQNVFGTLTSKIATLEVAPQGPELSAIESFKAGSSQDLLNQGRDFFSQANVDMIRYQNDLLKMGDYVPFMLDVQEFLGKYNGAISPPVLALVRGGQKLTDIAPQRREMYAGQWVSYAAMISDLEGLVAQGKTMSPPSTVTAFHAEMMKTLGDYLPIAKDALLQFNQFNEIIADDQFETLRRDITQIQGMIAGDVNFAEAWNLQDIVRSQTDIGPEFEETARTWADNLVRYRVVDSAPIQ
jgi:hypothetical protein